MPAFPKEMKTAQAAAYAAVEKVHFDDAQFRRDITGEGAAALT